MDELLKGNGRFAAELYKGLALGFGGNVFFSPLGLSSALAMLGAGARGATQDEMSAALRLPLDSAALHEAFGLLAGSLKLTVANALWAQEGLALLPEFQRTVCGRYGASVALLDFSDPKAAGTEIDRWVEKATQGKISRLIGRGDLDALTNLVVTNAVYFKGRWSLPFELSATREEPFTLIDGSTAPADLMRQTEIFPYYEDPELQLLELPYAGEDVSMLVLLPRGPAGLSEVERSLDGERLASLAARARRRYVEVLLPRFTMAGQFRADERLKELGMRAAFGPDADFSGVTDRRGLYLSGALHKSFITVNEAGTEAASATALIQTLSSRPSDIPVFRADRPFLFWIRDDRSGSLLFLGRFADPRDCATAAPSAAEPPKRASPPPDEGPCRFCGKPGYRKGDPREPWTPLLYECEACDSGRPRTSTFAA